MKVPLLDLNAQYASIEDEISQKIHDFIPEQRFILGPEVEKLEEELAEYSRARFAVGVSSGSDALIISLMALGIKKGDTVVTTPFTFFATVGAVSRLGARTVFCDIDPINFNMDPLSFKKVVEDKMNRNQNGNVKAVIPIHLFGQCADMKEILSYSDEYQIQVIEDAAQSIGADCPFPTEVRRAGSMGDMSIFSFFPTKNLGGYGDGGMVLTHDEGLAEKLKKLRIHGSSDKYFYELVGGNFRLDALQAVILRVKLKYLDEWHKKRQNNADYYDRVFFESGLTQSRNIQTPKAVFKDSGVENYHTYNQYVIRAVKRDELQQYLKEKNIGTAVYYPLPLHLQKCFSDLGYQKGAFPESEKASNEVLAIPVYPELTQNMQDYVVSSIIEFYRS